MSEEQLKAFLEKVKADTSLQEKLKAAADADAVLAIAKEAGFSVSVDDLKNAQSEISNGELEGAAGGTTGSWACTDCGWKTTIGIDWVCAS
ncbi:Nif11-like leader peptide family natural product precursor [Synechococcus sp. UW179A]|uniref:Nif11-like leader peptide family natural product precursor n=1 Tax=Synechococcus sp. UW179A TaxID=2575510 RepID=UPI000E0F15AF|nr:Nif11-like leader peptide family natural product precursor [Synechococcus sp. UW179A]